MKGKAIIISAPSGAGKTSIVKYLLGAMPQLEFSVSACSRPKRENEVDGRDYYFMTADEFRRRIDTGDFVEWQEVYPGSFYGTLKSELERIWNDNKVPLFELDVLGGLNLKNYFGEGALAVFIKPPSIAELESRLKNRGTESDESLRKRLEKAAFEMDHAGNFDIHVINEDLDIASAETKKIIFEFLQKKGS